MKRIISICIVVIAISSCSKEFLNVPPATGLSDDKLVDIPSMKALINGAYSTEKGAAAITTRIAAILVRDVVVKNDINHTQYFDHQISGDWGMFTNAYTVLGLLNTVAVKDVQSMEGTDAQKNAILGDMHFLRALVYFDLNNYFELPSTGLSVPLVLAPIGVNDQISCSRSEDIKNQIESDIEKARNYFKDISGVSNYNAATALAARIYFYHKKYDKAYVMANEVISSGKFSVDASVSGPFIVGNKSPEVIFRFIYNAADGIQFTATSDLANAYSTNPSQGFLSLNPASELSKFIKSNLSDARWINLFNVQGATTYIKKFPSKELDLPYIRLEEMYLTRAESNIMNTGAVSQQDMLDINKLRNRAHASTVINSVLSKQAALDTIYNDRTRELAIEMGDHYLNVKRLQKGIIKTAQEGGGIKPYSEYGDLLTFPFPENEVKIYGLSRN